MSARFLCAAAVLLLHACGNVAMQIDAEAAPIDAGRDTARDAESDARDTARDAGSDARDTARDAESDTARDTGTDTARDAESDTARDTARDADPAGVTGPTCVGEGVWRNRDPWCAPDVLSDYGCDLVFRDDGSTGEWSGTLAMVLGLRFVLYETMSSGGTAVYACNADPPAESHRQTCEVPFARECELAARYAAFTGGRDYLSMCAAAATRGLATRYLFSDWRLGC